MSAPPPVLTLKPKPPSRLSISECAGVKSRAVLGVSLGRRHAFVVMLAPLTSAVQIVSRQRVCPRLALSCCISCKANRKLHLLPASLVSTLTVWKGRLSTLAPHPSLSQHAVTLQFTFGGRERGLEFFCRASPFEHWWRLLSSSFFFLFFFLFYFFFYNGG